MKKNMTRTMDRLEIDEGSRPLLRQLWKHNYRTVHSCQGNHPENPREGYIGYRKETGDGWFEINCKRYGFEKLDNLPCCLFQNQAPIRIGKNWYYPIAPKGNYCPHCKAGINGMSTYIKPLNS
jgi:hypothetical protein